MRKQTAFAGAARAATTTATSSRDASALDNTGMPAESSADTRGAGARALSQFQQTATSAGRACYAHSSLLRMVELVRYAWSSLYVGRARDYHVSSTDVNPA